MLYREQLPSPSLARWVECVWSIQCQAPIDNYLIAPDGCLDIIYHRHNRLFATGAMTSEQRTDLAAGAELIGVRFKPGMARPYLGVPIAELTDISVPLEDLWSHRASEMKRRLDGASSIHEAAQILLSTLQPVENVSDAFRRAMEAITIAKGTADLDQIARLANLSPRQFRRRCREESGLSPKMLSRILRFRHASRLAHRTRPPDWSSVAVDAGYFDQSHLIHDFRDFTGQSPMSVFSNTQPVSLE